MRVGLARTAVLIAAAHGALLGTAAATEPPARQVVPAAQMAPATAPDAWTPGWYRRPGEGPFSLRPLREGLYIDFGGHFGASRNARLTDDGACQDSALPISFFYFCSTARPQGHLGIGGGISLGLGTRVAPALRVALHTTYEFGYEYRNKSPWYLGPAEIYDRFRVSSLQVAGTAYLDIGGLVPPGALGKWNPYLSGTLGIARNHAGDITETTAFDGQATFRYGGTGGTRTGLLWGVGAGVQYHWSPGITVDAGYRYVDAGRVRANAFGGDITETFAPIRTHLRTHRFQLSLNFALASLFR